MSEQHFVDVPVGTHDFRGTYLVVRGYRTRGKVSLRGLALESPRDPALPPGLTLKVSDRNILDIRDRMRPPLSGVAMGAVEDYLGRLGCATTWLPAGPNQPPDVRTSGLLLGESPVTGVEVVVPTTSPYHKLAYQSVSVPSLAWAAVHAAALAERLPQP